ncbi:MAG: TolC family protein [Muribaculaceae bacterium]
MKHSIILSLIACAASLSVAAQGSIEDVLATVEHNNARLKAAKARLSSDSIALRASNNLEDPRVGFEYNFGSKNVGDKWAIGISQGFDWPTLYSERNRANAHRIDALSAATRAEKADLLLSARQLCLNLIYINRQIEAQQLILNNVDELYSLYNKAFEHGEASIIDINKIKIERIATQQALDELRSTRNTLKEQLAGMNGNQPIEGIALDELTAYPADILQPIDVYRDQFASGNPQAEYFNHIDNSTRSDVKVAKMGWLPKLELGYQYTNELGDGFNGVTVGASIPLFSNKRKVSAAKAEAITNELNRATYQSDIEAQIKAEYARAVALKSQLTQYGDVIGDNSNFTVLRKALDGGQITLLNYLLELRYFLDAKNKYLDIEHTYHATLASLSRYQ